MGEYWLISVPEMSEGESIFDKINRLTKNLSTNTKLVVPLFKFGNIDDLIRFTEDSVKIILLVETIITRMVQNIKTLLDEREDLSQNLQVNGQSLNSYVQSFHWDFLKYPIRKRPQTIIADVSEQCTLILEKMKCKVSEYNGLKNEVEKIEARHTGSLLARDLSDFVKKEDIIIGSKFLQTVLILVPCLDLENWKNYYEHFWQGIVPGSSKLLYQDHDFGLFTVVVTKDTVEDFKSWSLKSRIIVRKFEYNEDEIKLAKMTEYKIKMQLIANRRNLQFWLKKHYSLCFSMYFHVQILRVLSESILKYGLVTQYSVILIKPKINNKVRKILNSLFNTLEENAYPDTTDIIDDPYMYTYPHCGSKEYYPYVNCCINVAGCPMKAKVRLIESISRSAT